MAFQFFGIYFETDKALEYRCGFYDDTTQYMPILERKDNGVWVEVNQKLKTGNARVESAYLRSLLPITITFNKNHTQNERMELINQVIYNINRLTTERVNYQGAHN